MLTSVLNRNVTLTAKPFGKTLPFTRLKRFKSVKTLGHEPTWLSHCINHESSFLGHSSDGRKCPAVNRKVAGSIPAVPLFISVSFVQWRGQGIPNPQIQVQVLYETYGQVEKQLCTSLLKP